MRPVLRSTAVFGVSEGLAIIYERADVAIIGYWLGKTAAGLYAPAVSLMTTLFLIPQAIYEVMLPVTSETYARNPLLIRRQAYRIILLSTALGIGMGLGLAVIARPLVWLVYGREYAISGELLTILSAILVLKSVSFAVAAVLTAVGWQNRRVIVQAVAAALNIGLNMALIQTVGLPGVAYVYVLTEAVLMVGYLLFYLRWQHGYPIQSVAQT
jgi:O-antigen/teichoic acid export membrane protein